LDQAPVLAGCDATSPHCAQLVHLPKIDWTKVSSHISNLLEATEEEECLVLP
jgi:hypothetical protein